MIGVIPRGREMAGVEEIPSNCSKHRGNFFRKAEHMMSWLRRLARFPCGRKAARHLTGPKLKTVTRSRRLLRVRNFRDVTLDYQGIRVPIYGETLTFEGTVPASSVSQPAPDSRLKISSAGLTVLRLGYDCFKIEIPPLGRATVEFAQHPYPGDSYKDAAGLDTGAGNCPSGNSSRSRGKFSVCLTTRHRFVEYGATSSTTQCGVPLSLTVGAIRDFVRRRISFGRLLKIWRGSLVPPICSFGVDEDFWVPFDWYLQIEKTCQPPIFVPFKKRVGERVSGRHRKEARDFRTTLRTFPSGRQL